MLDNKNNQSLKFRTKNWVEMNDYLNGIFEIGNQIKLKTIMLKPSLGDYSDSYILGD